MGTHFPGLAAIPTDEWVTGIAHPLPDPASSIQRFTARRHGLERISGVETLTHAHGKRAQSAVVAGIGRFLAVISFLVTIHDQIVNDSEFYGQLNLGRIVFKSFPQSLSLCSQFFDSHFQRL
jgi:hypothetical protein